MRSLVLRAIALALLVTCAREPAPPQGPLTPEDQQIRELERQVASRRRNPQDVLDLSAALLDRARRSLEAGDQKRYVLDIAQAQRELLDLLSELPRLGPAHNQLAILSAYAADLEGARRGFRIASGLDRGDPVSQLNLAEVAVYQDRLPDARGHIGFARRNGADPTEAKLVEVLIAWKEGDLVEARDRLGDAREIDAERVRTWNGASDIQSFDDLARHCCLLPFCGPYMRKACTDIGQAVVAQQRSEETLLEELRLEIERAKAQRAAAGVEVRTEP